MCVQLFNPSILVAAMRCIMLSVSASMYVPELPIRNHSQTLEHINKYNSYDSVLELSCELQANKCYCLLAIFTHLIALCVVGNATECTVLFYLIHWVDLIIAHLFIL